MPTVIHAHNLRKKYGQHLAVDGIDLNVERGSIYGLVGPNGAGKTTILRMLVDVIRPTSGDLTVLGEVPRQSNSALRQRIGYLPGELKLNTRVTGKVLLKQLEKVSGPVEETFVATLAERLGLDLSRPVHALSKGNKQKIGLVQAFMHRPELLILDEPTSGLDPLMQREFLALVREAQSEGQTVLLSSHILSEIQHAADEVAVLTGGKIVADSDVSSLRLASISHLRATLAGTLVDDVLARFTPLPDLQDVQVTPAPGDLVRLTASVRGDIDAVIKALAHFQVLALSIKEPGLEESILNLYSSEAVNDE
jgi:ABC-2 type transport system ATP-binding protein